MITFYQESDANLKKAVDEYAEEVGKLKPYEIFCVSLYSSDGNEYVADGMGFEHEPTKEELLKHANNDWAEYHQGITPDDQKEKTIQNLLDSYVIVQTK